MSVKPLKQICQEQLVKEIKNLPPMLIEEVIGQTRMEMRSEIIREMKVHIPFLVCEFADEYKKSYKKARRNPPIFHHIPYDLQNVALEAGEEVVKHFEKELLYDNYRDLGSIMTFYNNISEDDSEDEEMNNTRNEYDSNNSDSDLVNYHAF